MVDNNILTNPSPIQRNLTVEQKAVLQALKAKIQNRELKKDDVEKVLKEKVAGKGGNANAIDTPDEIQFVRDLFTASGAEDDLKPVQEALRRVAPQLKIFGTTPEGEVNEAVKGFGFDGDNMNYGALAGRLPGGAQSARDIESRMQRWRVRNAGNTFDMPSQALLEAAEKASQARISSDKLNGLETTNQKQLRAILHTFWNNDGQGLQNISMQELEAIHQWGLAHYEDQEQFRQDFAKIFLKSVAEDTHFNVELMARQFIQALGSSAFFGDGGEDFKNFLANSTTDLGNYLIRTNKLRHGELIAAFNGQAEHPGFDNVVLQVNDGSAEIKISPSATGDAQKIGYQFGKGGKVQLQAQPIAGQPQEGKIQVPPPQAKLDENKANELIGLLQALGSRLQHSYESGADARNLAADITSLVSLVNSGKLETVAGRIYDIQSRIAMLGEALGDYEDTPQRSQFISDIKVAGGKFKELTTPLKVEPQGVGIDPTLAPSLDEFIGKVKEFDIIEPPDDLTLNGTNIKKIEKFEEDLSKFIQGSKDKYLNRKIARYMVLLSEKVQRYYKENNQTDKRIDWSQRENYWKRMAISG